jgi:hypothetical protein
MRKWPSHISLLLQTTENKMKNLIRYNNKTNKSRLFFKNKLFLLVHSTFAIMLAMDTLIKFAPALVATAFASIVLPVPGGPKSSIPFTGYQKETCW